MVALVDAKEATGRRFLGRVRRRLFGVHGLSAVYDEILGMNTMLITIETAGDFSSRETEKQIFTAAEIIRKSGCKKICFSKNFPYRDEFSREGFVEIEDGILYERLAGRIVAHIEGEDKTAVLFAKYLSLHSERALTALCEGFRYVMADIETGGGRVIDRLAKQYGVSIIERPSQRQLDNADAAVFFHAPERKTVLSDRCVAIAAGKDALAGVTCGKVVSDIKIALKSEKALNLPEKFPINSLTAAAMDAGMLFPDEIRLLDVEITRLETRLDKEPCFYYNKCSNTGFSFPARK
jgi:hypothetical protein